MQKSIFLFLLFLGFTQLAFPVTQYNYGSCHKKSSSGPTGDPKFESKYDFVYVDKQPNVWNLRCEFPGGKACTWANAGVGSSSLDPQETVAHEADVQQMTDHAIDQAEAGVYTGSYNSNLIVGTTTYYRTVTWDYNTTTEILDVDVIVSF